MQNKKPREFHVTFLFLLLAGAASAAPSPQLPLAGSAIPQFVDPLPTLSNGITALLGSQPRTLSICEFKAHVLPTGTFAPGVKPETWVWGYIPGDRCPSATEVQESYLGPVLVNLRHQPTELTFLNQLGTAATTNLLAYRYSTDQTLHWADPLGAEQNFCQMFGGIPAFGTLCAQNYAGPIPASVHLHGGEVPPELDGGPDSWWTNAIGLGPLRGHGFYTKGYPNPPAQANAAVYV